MSPVTPPRSSSPQSLYQARQALTTEKVKNTNLQNQIKQLKADSFSPESTIAIALLAAAGAAMVVYLAASPTAIPAIKEFVGATIPNFFSSIWTNYGYINPPAL